MNRPKQSHLQNQILLYLSGFDEPIKSLAELARYLNVHRTSVSRSMHALNDGGFVTKKDDGEWLLTEIGQEEVGLLREQATQKIKATIYNLANLSHIASDSVSPVLNYARQLEEQQSGFSKAMTSTLVGHYPKLLDEVFSNNALLEITNVVEGRNTANLEAISSQYQTLLDEALPRIKFNEIVAQQSALLDSFRNLGVFETYKKAIASTLINTVQISSLVDAMKPSMYTRDLLNTHALNQLVESFSQPSLSEAAARMGKTDLVYKRLIQEAATFATANQQLNQWALNLNNLTPDITRQLGQNGVSINRTISAIAIMKASQPFDDILMWLTPHVTEITRTHLSLYTNAISQLESRQLLGAITLPSNITADYVDIVATIAAPPSNETDELWIYHSDINDQVVTVLENVDPRFLSLWNGAWETIDSDNPDRLHQAAHSGRELLMQILAQLSPDSNFSQEEIEFRGGGKVTHRMRITKILEANSVKGKWASAIADAVIAGLNAFTGISHYRSAQPPVNASQLKGMLITLGGLLVVCLQAFEDDDHSSENHSTRNRSTYIN